MPVSKTLPDHATCGTHESYLLSCADYEDLLAESRGGCFICRFPAARMPQRKLYIDHGGYRWAVRGLLCVNCNSGLGDYHHPAPAGADEYLANAWYLRKLAERGLSLDEQPSVGSIVRDHFGIPWYRASGDRWMPFQCIQRDRDWGQMYRFCGPLNMRVIQVWDGRDHKDLRLGPPGKRPPTKTALERRISEALAVAESRDWCPDDREAITDLMDALTGTAPAEAAA